MKLSEAILLGDLLRKRNSGVYYTRENNCGCAIGGAVLAVGRSRAKEFLSWDAVKEVGAYWPWFQPEHDKRISNMFAEVCGEKPPYPYTAYEPVSSLEALCDQVRAWEDELAAKGINVEQVTMAATPETTHQPAAEHIEKVSV